MALTVETGAGIPGADSYISLADAATYHTNRGNSAWAAAASDSVREAALRNATAYLDGKYRLRWKGWRVLPVTQNLEWPRVGVEYSSHGSSTSHGFYGLAYYPSDQIPQRLKDAVCVAALKALSGSLAADLEPSQKRVKVGSIEIEYDMSADGAIEYQELDQLLSDLLLPAGQGTLVRG